MTHLIRITTTFQELQRLGGTCLNITLTHLIERLNLGLHYERKLAELTGARLRRRQPLDQTSLVNITEAP
jgi:hypothetical protein